MWPHPPDRLSRIAARRSALQAHRNGQQHRPNGSNTVRGVAKSTAGSRLGAFGALGGVSGAAESIQDHARVSFDMLKSVARLSVLRRISAAC